MFLLSQYHELFLFFFFNDTATTEIYTLPLHDALPIYREAQAAARHDLAVDGHGLRRDRTHGEDPRLRRIDHRGELIDVEQPQIRDGKGGARVLSGLEPPATGLVGELARLAVDLREGLRVRVPEDRRDQPVLHGHRHAEVHLVPVADVIVLEPGVAGTVLGERERGRLEDDVVERDLALVAELAVQRVARLGEIGRAHV